MQANGLATGTKFKVANLRLLCAPDPVILFGLFGVAAHLGKFCAGVAKWQPWGS